MLLECKRRKIKCDRSQPCTPCTRRGEESGCQWHIVEPVEKYATKAEFDELKARYEQLAALVQRLLPSAAATPVPYYQMGVQPGISGVGATAEAVSSYPGTSGPLVYPSMMAPPPPPPSAPTQGSYSQHMDTMSSSQAPSRYIKPEETQSPTRHVHQSSLGGAGTSPIMSTALHSPSLSRHRQSESTHSPVSAAAAIKNSPLSLASITSPYHPDLNPLQQQQLQAQSKNYHAQTLMLGERLRPGAPTEGPAKCIGMTYPRWAAAAVVVVVVVVVAAVVGGITKRSCSSITPRRRGVRLRHPSICNQVRRVASVILAGHRHEMMTGSG
ncbi:hypothetical protein B0H34DRAFT_426641 [Crassisporium funariophilum]|nr:hypothetical protein B0H34DRAFT_426641 [Crassisporium funariophilum]